MRQLPPLRLKSAYFKSIEDEIKALFDALIYAPLAAVTGLPLDREIKNARDALADAIASGQVWYEDGLFKGSFNARISKRLREIGAKYNSRSNTWSLPPLLMPPEISIASARAESNYQLLRQNILTALDGVDIDSINVLSNIPDKYIKTINWMEGDFVKAVKAITIPPRLTDAQRGIIAAEWGQNLDLYVKDWTKKNILALREMVQTEAFEGNRAASMVKAIQENYGVSRRKAEFLARQETSLLMSKFRETRYRDIGSTRYKWSTSHDERVRHDHKILNGKIFSWDSPPVVDLKTGRTANPGEDFGCLFGEAIVQSFVLPEKLYRRRYSGKATSLVTDSGKTLCCTPNHPILTRRGWIAASLLHNGEDIFHVSQKGILVLEKKPQNDIASFEEFFSFFSVMFRPKMVSGGVMDFHGDASVNHQIDVVTLERKLMNETYPGLDKNFLEFIFSEANQMICLIPESSGGNSLSKFFGLRLSPNSIVGVLGKIFDFLFGGAGHSFEHSLAAISCLNAISDKMFVKGPAFNSEFSGERLHALTGDVSVYRLLFWEIVCVVRDTMMADYLMPSDLDIDREIISSNAEFSGDFSNIFPCDVLPDRVVDKGVCEFSDRHIFNLQNKNGWYSADGFIVHNCRCVAIALID